MRGKNGAARASRPVRGPSDPLRESMRTLTLLCLVLPALACRSSSASKARGSVEELIQSGQYLAALDLSAELHERRPGDPEAQHLHRRATVAFLLARGRQRSFRDDDLTALEDFEAALELEPECEQAQAWLAKTHEKVAFEKFEEGEELRAEGMLDPALEAYSEALRHAPDFESAREGALRVLLLLQYRMGLSEGYYHAGVRALREYELQIARAKFSYVNKYRPDDSRARERIGEVKKRIGETRLVVAKRFEEERLYRAARSEYRRVLLLDEENEEARAGYERMKTEGEALDAYDAAKMHMLRGDWEPATEELEQGLAVTVLQRELFENLRRDMDDARSEMVYQQALDLEHEFRFEEALAVYTHILEEREWYKDARARHETLEEYVARAAEAYAAAAAADTVEERTRKLREIETFWPDYKDVPEQLAALGGAREEEGDGNAASEPPDDGDPEDEAPDGE